MREVSVSRRFSHRIGMQLEVTSVISIYNAVLGMQRNSTAIMCDEFQTLVTTTSRLIDDFK